MKLVVTGKRKGQWKPCSGPSCAFLDKKRNTCKCEDGSLLCPFGRVGIEGTMLVSHTRRVRDANAV